MTAELKKASTDDEQIWLLLARTYFPQLTDNEIKNLKLYAAMESAFGTNSTIAVLYHQYVMISILTKNVD